MLFDMEYIFVCCGIFGVEGFNLFDEGFYFVFFEDVYEGRFESFVSIRGNFSNGSFGVRVLLNVVVGDLFEFEVMGDIGGDEDIG